MSKTFVYYQSGATDLTKEEKYTVKSNYLSRCDY